MLTRDRVANLGWLSLVMLMWAAQFPAYRIASESMSISALNACTFAFAIVVLLPFALYRRGRAPAATRTRPPSGTVGSFVLLAGAGILPPSLLLSWGIQHSSASNGAILTLTQPVLMLALAVPMLGEKFTPRRLIALVIALAGTVCLSQNDLKHGSFTSSTLLGNAAIVLGVAGGSFYNIYSKRLLEEFTELEVLIYGFIVAAVVCAGLSLLFDPHPVTSLRGVPERAWLAVLVLAGMTWGLAMVLFMWLLKRLDIAQVAVSTYLLSFFGVILSALALGERLTLVQIAGGAIVVVATVMADSVERSSASQR